MSFVGWEEIRKVENVKRGTNCEKGSKKEAKNGREK
jgi:hypothetical protein